MSKVHIGSIVSFGDGSLKAKCVKKEDMGICEFRLIYKGIFIVFGGKSSFFNKK